VGGAKGPFFYPVESKTRLGTEDSATGARSDQNPQEQAKMCSMRNEFDERVHEAITRFRYLNEQQKKLRYLADKEPVRAAAELLFLTSLLSRLWNREFEKKPTPDWLHESVIWTHALNFMDSAAAQYPKGSEEQGRAVCAAFFRAFDAEPILIDFIRQNLTNPGIQEDGAAALAGWVGAHIDLKLNQRVTAALRDNDLVRELPAAVALAWSEQMTDEPLRPTGERRRNLVSRTEWYLSRVGNEGDEKFGRIAAEELDEQAIAGPTDDLEEFELRETFRQELNTVRAEFSPRERQVYELDIQTDHDTAAIARELDITADTVRGVRKRYRHKIRGARQAAGL
jgi:hypothetical protein